MINIKAALGIEGVSHLENNRAIRVGKYFSYVVFLALIVVAVQLVLDYSDKDQSSVWISAIVWSVFTAELLVNLYFVDDKWRYARHNWLNIVIVILVFPWIDYGGDWAAIFRALRLLLFLRVALDALWDVIRLLQRNNFGVVLAVALVFVIIAGAVFSVLEDTDFASGLWYVLVTVTTVGYGDLVPRTETGRVFGAFLILFGVVLFSIVTANIAAFLIGSDQKQREQEIVKSLYEVREHLEAQSKKNEQRLAQILEEMNRKVDDLEKRLQSDHSAKVEHGIGKLETHLRADNEAVLDEIKRLVKKLEKGH